MTGHTQGTIAISGATGFVGSELSRILQADGWTVIPLRRRDLAGEAADLAECLRGVRGVINLAGAPILKRWTEGYKKTLIESRVGTTHRLVAAMALLEQRPAFFISTSAVGYYAEGRRHTEDDHTHALTFLGDLTRGWEQEAWRAEELGVRTVIFRLGVVLGPGGGALAQMLPAFRLGLGGTIGDGAQSFPWIHRDDLMCAYRIAIADTGWEGVYNLTAPEPTTNAKLTRALGAALHRPTWLPVPAPLLWLLFGEAATVLTQGQEVAPKRLLEAGFQFSYRTVEQAVRQCLGLAPQA